MASAGRILIMPKGEYDASVTYEMLDMVFYNGTSWLAKKTAEGIEPSETNGEHWHKFIDIGEVLSNYLHLDGGILRGQLGLGGGKGNITATPDMAILQAKQDDNTFRDIIVQNPSKNSESNEWVQLGNFVEGTYTTYNIFGEHNIDLLNQYIDSRIAAKMN